MNKFIKSHGLGNEYIVLNSETISFKLTKTVIEKMRKTGMNKKLNIIFLTVP